MGRMQKKIRKYRITQKIEESNYAIIYRVKDAKNKPLVLKIARKKSAEYNELISREFQILSKFKHPNIVSVFDYDINDDGRTYFTLEYITGKPINRCFKNFSEDFIAAIMQIINALGTFHNKGFIHGDLKPENILYNRDEEKIALIDFGFAGIPSCDTAFAGTFGYVAPEVIKGTGIDQRSDLYSLGVIIYEIISGSKFEKAYKPIKNIPKEINNIIARLISKEPTLRPTIPELHQIFSKYLTSIKLETPPYKVGLPNTGFVETPEIIEKLLTIKGKAIIINGDTGAGKTRLLQEMKFKYLMQDCPVLFHISREKRKFSECLQNFIGGKKFIVSDKENKFQIYEEITRELIAFAKNKNVVIMLDDLEELSDYGLGLFRYIGYGIQDTNILLIGTSKFNKKIKNLGFETLSLKPFTVNEIQKLLEKTFFRLEPAKVIRISHTPDFAQWLHKQSGGNPLFIVEILKTLYENKILYYQTNKWQVKTLHKTVVPKKLGELLETRIKKLSADDVDILKVLSLIGHPLESIVISVVLKTKIDINVEHLKNLGLLKEEIINSKRVILIPNQILIQTTKKIIAIKEKQQLLKSIIKAIETILAEEKNYLPILAQLSDEVGESGKAYDYFQKSAKHAELIYDYDSALKYYSQMLKYEEDNYPRKYPESLIKIADINQTIGNNRIAIDSYKKVMNCKRKDLLSAIYSGMGRAYSGMGNHNEAVKFLKKSVSSIKKGDNQNYIKTANRLAYSLMSLKHFDEAETILNQLFLLSKKIKNIEMTADTMYYQTVHGWAQGNYDKGIKIAKENLRFTQKHQLLKQFAYTANLLVLLYRQKNDINHEQKYLEQAINSFKQMKLTNALASVLSTQASFYHWQANFSKARKLHEKTLILSQQTGNQTTQCMSLYNLASISEALGEFNEAIQFNEKALDIKPDAVIPNCNLSMLYYKKGKVEKAKSILERAIKKEKFLLYYICLALINLSLGKREYAEEMLTKGLDKIRKNNLDISARIDLFLRTSQFYYEIYNFEKSLIYAEKVKEITPQSSREHIIASALVKINNFNLDKISDIDVNKKTSILKNMGCVYDYAYLKKLKIESIINNGIKPDQIKKAAEGLNEVQKIFASLGAELELNRVKKIQGRLYPIILEDYSKRVISTEYLETFSKLAELIHTHLGDKDFVQNILDLIIQTTNAERGALFIKASKEMQFIAGKDIDHTTIKDAREFSRTAIKEIGKNRIVFSQNALSDPDFNIKKSVILNQIRSLLCIPLSVSGNVIGAIYLDSRITSSIFGLEDKNFLVTVSKILASVIEKSMAFRAITEENILLKSKMIEEIGSGYIIGKSLPMRKVYRLIDDVAQTNSPVLILGETGTGKGMLARLIHLKSKRRDKRFLTINCGTIPETLLESELFGHKKGSFTGAVSDKKGLLEEGESGTVFLDEITNTSPSFQAKLLEAIEEKIIRRVGETISRDIDVRFLFATNRDLEIEVEEGRFRKDLFYRINVFRIEVPPLRERIKDMPLLAQFFLERFSKEMNKKIKGFTAEAMQKLKEYFWPGNIRELQNIIDRAVVLAKGRLITIQDIGFGKIKQESVSLREIKREAIVEALNATNWNIAEAARSLKVTRRTIYKYIKKYRIKK